jgi:hypothetical protein
MPWLVAVVHRVLERKLRFREIRGMLHRGIKLTSLGRNFFRGLAQARGIVVDCYEGSFCPPEELI